MMRRHQYIFLLASLLLVVVVRPFIGGEILGVSFLEIALFVGLVGAGIGTATGTASRITLFVLTAASIVTRGAWLRSPSDTWLLGFLATTSALYAVIIVLLTRSFFTQAAKVTANTLCAALSTYMVIGLLWSMLYALLTILDPGSLQLGSGELITAVSDFDRFLGFSFTTLTTLGYGNIAPVTARADALANLEAIVGQMYVAVVIARLVAIQMAQEVSA